MTGPSLLDLAARLDAGDATSEQVTESALDLIESDNPQVGAFLELDVAGARTAALDSDRRRRSGRPLGVLDGVPIAVKANLAVAGLAWSAGIAARRDRIADTDADAVASLRRAGAVIVGTTNMAEAAIGAVTANPTFGPARNPHRLDRHAGGSSGGSAAAVAAGMASAALGTDTMGSVRIPASWCGLCGWKPTGGLIPSTGLLPLADRLDTVGVIAATPDDVLAMGRAGGWLTSEPVEPLPISGVAVPRDLVDRCRPGVVERFEATLQASGMMPVDVMFGLDPQEIRRAGLLAVEAGGYDALREDLTVAPEGFSPRLREMLEYSVRAPAWKLARAHRTLDGAQRRLVEVLAVAPLMALPTTPVPPLLIGDDETPELGDLTAIVNAAGACAVTLPMGEVDGGPVGIQLVAAPGADVALLEAAVGVGRRLQR